MQKWMTKVCLADHAQKRNPDHSEPVSNGDDYLVRKIADEYSLTIDTARTIVMLAGLGLGNVEVSR